MADFLVPLLAEHGLTHEMVQGLLEAHGVRARYPLSRNEAEALQVLQDHRPPPFTGLPGVLALGDLGGKPYALMALLGAPVSELFRRLLGRPLALRWGAVRVLGRLLLRRLEALHRHGIVHGNVRPESIALGRPRSAGPGAELEVPPRHPFFASFDCAQPLAGGRRMTVSWGAMDFASVQLTGGGSAAPHDDLESLGWVLCHGLLGETPWLRDRSTGKSTTQVRWAKTQFLQQGPGEFGPRWAHLADVPAGLREYLRRCWQEGSAARDSGRLPDYSALEKLLDGQGGLGAEEAEARDLELYAELVAQLPEPDEAELQAQELQAAPPAQKKVPILLREGQRVLERCVIQSTLGLGMAGAVVFWAEDCQDPARRQVALKYPVSDRELQVWQALHARRRSLLGIPQLVASGRHNDKPCVVMELLGAPVTGIFQRLRGQAVEVRWRVVRVLGSLLLRRLEKLHQSGFIHCDVQPFNVLMGPAEGQAHAPFLVDFGEARPMRSSETMLGHHGSVDFNSIRSASSTRRGALDDLESLGWTLCYGLLGELPWFETSAEACWSQGDTGRISRSQVCRQVQWAKARWLDLGADAFGPRWAHLAEAPAELLAFLRLCRGPSDAFAGCEGDAPDYGAMAALLGARAGEAWVEAESADLGLLREELALLPELAE